MRAVDPKIEELNLVVYAKDQPQYLQLPARVDDNGTAITCWKFSWRERLRLLFSGSLYLTIMTFRQPLQPVMLGLKPPPLEYHQPPRTFRARGAFPEPVGAKSEFRAREVGNA